MGGAGTSENGVYAAYAPVNDADSALEALCVRPQGDQRLQLARQLTATALNCVMTSGSGTCAGVSVHAIFEECNAACAGGLTTAHLGADSVDCVAALDCFNNEGVFDPADGSCTIGHCVDTAGHIVGECGLDGTCAPLPGGVVPACAPFPGNCHARELCNEPLGLCFEETGPAGSSKACSSARQSACAILPGGESSCAAGTRSTWRETCT